MTLPKDPPPTSDALQATLLTLEQHAYTRLQSARDRTLIVDPSPADIRRHLQANYPFAVPMPSHALLADVVAMLDRWELDSTHSRCFGLFNPPALPITAAADALVSIRNPQVGTYTHSPAANEIERHALDYLARRIGFDPGESGAHFTSGGQEANTTAVAMALAEYFPTLPDTGMRALSGQPRLYASELSHHSLVKATKLLGLGQQSLHLVGTDANGAMDVDALGRAIAEDRAAGDLPFMLVGTAGTTGTDSIDPLPALADVGRREQVWLHVDAAWGGGALMSDRLRIHLEGIEQADSVTWDAHKWLNVPMGAGMLFYRRGPSNNSMFRVTTGHVPSPPGGLAEPYQHTAQWSRRFIGLKVFMALASLSAAGYARLVEHQATMGDVLRDKLRGAGWRIVNQTPLPLVCCSRDDLEAGPDALQSLVDRLVKRGRVWVSQVTLPDGRAAIRACVTSYDATEEDLDVLVEELEEASISRW